MSIPIVAHDADLSPIPLTYSVSGLPAGLAMDPATGLISGTLQPGSEGVYSPAVTVSDGLSTNTKPFPITILPPGSSTPSASIWINGTAATNDDITWESIPVSATIVGTPLTTVSLFTTGPARVNTPTVVLNPMGRATVWIISTGLSVAADDVHVMAFVRPTVPFAAAPPPVKVDDVTLSKVGVTIPDINRPYENYNPLPAGSKTHPLYRIPPRVDTTIEVTLSIDLSRTAKVVTLATAGTSDSNGRFTMNGVNTISIQQNTKVRFRGTKMTEPGNYSQLTVQVTAGATAAASSAFSVSAIPIKFKLKEVGRNAQQRPVPFELTFRDGSKQIVEVGMMSVFVVYFWDSDSGDIKDLDKVWVGEYITSLDAQKTATWDLMNEVPAGTSYVLPRPRDKFLGPLGTLFDNFKMPGDKKPKPEAGSFRTDQWYGFRDGRSESMDKNNMTHEYQNDFAYFQSTRRVFKDPRDNKFYYEYDRVENTTPVLHEPAGLPFRLAVT